MICNIATFCKNNNIPYIDNKKMTWYTYTCGMNTVS